jgi:hypothetical protein
MDGGYRSQNPSEAGELYSCQSTTGIHSRERGIVMKSVFSLQPPDPNQDATPPALPSRSHRTTTSLPTTTPCPYCTRTTPRKGLPATARQPQTQHCTICPRRIHRLRSQLRGCSLVHSILYESIARLPARYRPALQYILLPPFPQLPLLVSCPRCKQPDRSHPPGQPSIQLALQPSSPPASQASHPPTGADRKQRSSAESRRQHAALAPSHSRKPYLPTILPLLLSPQRAKEDVHNRIGPWRAASAGKRTRRF